MGYKNVHVIINPASGGDEPILNTINDVMSKISDTRWNASVTFGHGDGAAAARDAIERGCDLVMAYGGDGTQLDVAEGLLGRAVPLGILPGGTANALAAELEIPRRLRPALEMILSSTSTTRAIDVGVAGDTYFLLRVGTGMVESLSDIPRDLKNRFGLGAYLITGINALNNPYAAHYRLTIDGKVIETDGAACLITSASSLGALGIRLAPDILIDDGLLDVYVINNDLPSILGLAGSIMEIAEFKANLQHWRGQVVHIDADPPQQIFSDGENEPRTTTPTTIKLLPGALKVVVPITPGTYRRTRTDQNQSKESTES